MPPTPPAGGWPRIFAILGTFVQVVVCLYFGRSVLIIVALGILLSFVLQPVVAYLQRAGLRRALAVVLTVLGALAVVGGLAGVFTVQIRGLTADWPKYQQQIDAKLRQIGPEWVERVQESAKAVAGKVIEGALGPLFESLLTVVFIVILVIFFLLRREDLRNRLIRLVGQDRRTVLTTKALDEAAQRISKFLLMQLLINAAFGIILGVGLFVLGVGYAPLWGLLAVAMRFIPYVGTWVAMVLPALFSVGTAEGWAQPVEVVVLFLGLEVLTANVAEPLLFGMSAGVSPVALLVSAVFWGWLWGPIGLVLSTPITVCLYVLGRYVPQLEVFEVLLGEEPPLEPSVSYYQRLLARDRDEATDLVEEQAQTRRLDEVFDDILAPALILARRDREQGQLSEVDERFILDSTRDLVTEVGYFASLVAKPVAAADSPAPPPPAPVKAAVLGCPAADEFDEVALLMLRQLAEPAGVPVQVASARMLTSEVIGAVEKEAVQVVLIASLPPGGVAQTRYLCKRLRSRFPDLKILVGRWGVKDNAEQVRSRLTAAGADQVGLTLAESRAQLLPLAQTMAHVKGAAVG